MKKTAMMMLAMLTAAALTGCRGETNTQQTPAMGLEEQTPPVTEGQDLYNEVYLWPEQDAYLPDTERISVTVSNNTDEEIAFGEDYFKLYRVTDDGQEEAVPYKDGGDYFFETAVLVQPHSTGTFTAQLAAHFNLPLPEGHYLIELETGLRTGFQVTSDASEIITKDPVNITMETEQAVYPAGTGEISVTITNQGDTDFHISLTDFGIEKFEDGAVSMTLWHSEIGCETRPSRANPIHGYCSRTNSPA